MSIPLKLRSSYESFVCLTRGLNRKGNAIRQRAGSRCLAVFRDEIRDKYYPSAEVSAAGKMAVADYIYSAVKIADPLAR